MNLNKSKVEDYHDRINLVINYIQKHLTEKLSIDELANIACFSTFHFHRIFTAFVGEPLYQFIRRLRLEKAASEVSHSTYSVTEIAFNAGYETPAAFTKAFKQYFNVPPESFRKRKKIDQKSFLLKSQNKLKNDKEEIIMEPKIQKLPAQQVLYARKTGPYKESAAEAWGTLMKFAYSNKLMDKNTKCIGISYDCPEITEAKDLRYDACITISGKTEVSGEINSQQIDGGEYAVFLHKGAYEKLNESYAEIFKSWLPQSDYRLRNIPCFELYLNRDPRKTKPENLRTEIYVPIVIGDVG
ncbi:GyrI-like domain-containing protein [Candidatus Margulisiibacteriota bacterium]